MPTHVVWSFGRFFLSAIFPGRRASEAAHRNHRIRVVSSEHLKRRGSQNKGAALFPRKIDGHFVALSRFDTENNYVMRRDNLRIWSSAEKLESLTSPWAVVRIGNCWKPTPDGQTGLDHLALTATPTTRIARIPLDALLEKLCRMNG